MEAYIVDPSHLGHRARIGSFFLSVWDEAAAEGEGGRCGAVVDVDLLKDVADVIDDGAFAKHQPLCDIPVRQALGHEFEDLSLPG